MEKKNSQAVKNLTLYPIFNGTPYLHGKKKSFVFGFQRTFVVIFV